MIVTRLFLFPRLEPSGSDAILFVILLVVASGFLTISVVLYFQYRRFHRQYTEQVNALSTLADISSAIASAPPEPEELAEIVFLEAARIFETDFFQIGVFEGDTYRTLFWVRDSNRQENEEFILDPEQEGLIGWIRRVGKPLLIKDFNTERATLPAEPSYQSPDPPRSGLFVPLLVEDTVIGIIAIQNRRPGTFDENHLQLLTTLACGVASSLTVFNSQSEVEYRTLQLVLTQEISRRLISLQPLSERLTQVASLIVQTFDYERVAIYEHIDDKTVTRASASGHPIPENEVRKLSKTLVEHAVQEGLTLLHTPDGKDQQTDSTDPSTSSTELAVPLKIEDRILGVLNIHARGDRSIPPEQIAMAEMLAAQITIAMLEARNYAQQQEEAWITTVLLEVAKHASQPGDVESALQAVLQLTTLLAGTDWAMLLLPSEEESTLQVGPVAGLRRQRLEQISTIRIPHVSLGIEGPFQADATSIQVTLQEPLAQVLDCQQSVAIVISDGISLLGVLLLEGQELIGRQHSLLTGIAHQISLRLENTRLIEEAATRQSFERELAMARNIQTSFLPEDLPHYPGWEIGVTWGMAREVGGDFYDFIPLPEGPEGSRWGVVIADVSDKGIPAALYMALCRTLMRSVAISRIDPGETLQRVNQLLLADTKAELFVSVFYAVWEPEIARFTYANAGHNPPMIFEPETPARILPEHGMVLGIREQESYESSAIILPPNQLLVLYTDGITEAVGNGGELFGLHRLESLILGIQDWTPQRVADLIEERVSDFSGTTELSDDLTAVILRRVS